MPDETKKTLAEDLKGEMGVDLDELMKHCGSTTKALVTPPVKPPVTEGAPAPEVPPAVSPVTPPVADVTPEVPTPVVPETQKDAKVDETKQKVEAIEAKIVNFLTEIKAKRTKPKPSSARRKERLAKKKSRRRTGGKSHERKVKRTRERTGKGRRRKAIMSMPSVQKRKKSMKRRPGQQIRITMGAESSILNRLDEKFELSPAEDPNVELLMKAAYVNAFAADMFEETGQDAEALGAERVTGAILKTIDAYKGKEIPKEEVVKVCEATAIVIDEWEKKVQRPFLPA
jgi:hypothetical protein